MDKTVEAIAISLETLATVITGAWTDDRTLTEAFGWNHPALTRHDLAAIPKRLAVKLREISPDNLTTEQKNTLINVPNKIALVQQQTVPQFFTGNGIQAIPSFIATMNWVSQTVEPFFSWTSIQDNKMLPPQMARRIRSYYSTLEQTIPDIKLIQAQANVIKEATAAAESLPTDMQALVEGRKKISEIEKASGISYDAIIAIEKIATERSGSLKELHLTAERVVDQCEEAYRIATTKGLAAAFEQRAARVAITMWVWVGGLLVALIAGVVLGHNRIDFLTHMTAVPDPKWGQVMMNVIGSLISLAAPLWFAWISTKQIGQRFRLSEDYAFKATVAKAYEGYRKEAGRIDKAFEARLFSSALTRLEEAPLRLMDTENHGSPWHELLNSAAFIKALEIVPELRDVIINATKGGLSSILSKPEKKSPPPKSPGSPTPELLRPTQSWSPLPTLADSRVKRPRVHQGLFDQKSGSRSFSVTGGAKSCGSAACSGFQSGNIAP